MVVGAVALVAALGGTVYAAGKINGRSIKVKSLPGNRLALHSVPGNRLKPGSIPVPQLAAGSVQGDRLAPGSVTGLQVDVSTLGQVPSAVHADNAESAKDAETALKAVTAETANRINGYEAGCKPGTMLFAGACWQTAVNSTELTAPNAANACANEGGELPDPLLLAAFSQQPGIAIATGDEWTDSVTNVSGPDLYAVVTVSPSGTVSSELSTNTKKFRCVIPLVG
ncbi:MAG TPA: hypothetical protein VFL77_01130 [Solirubrobacterales bacterium]|nr:hypothetical protein [Solirubrobacterales bacterium]